MSRSLSIVDSAERPRHASSTIRDAVQLDERALLVALRRRLAVEIDLGVPPHALAPLMRQLRELDKEIRALDEPGITAAAAVDEPFDPTAI